VSDGNIQSKTGESQLSSSEIIDLADSLQVVETQNQVCKRDSATPCGSGVCDFFPCVVQLIEEVLKHLFFFL
jgi:hypothetical protein